MGKLLGQHDRYRARAREEVQNMCKGNNLSLDGLRECQFLDACFNETLRMYPPVGGDVKFAMEDDVLPTGVRIRKNGLVVVPNYMIGKNDALFPDAGSFL